MTVLQIILFFTHVLIMSIGYQMGKQDGKVEGRIESFQRENR